MSSAQGPRAGERNPGMTLVDFLDRPIAFHRAFVGLGIGVTGALMLSQVVYWTRRAKDDDGWFFKTQEEWEDETGLTRTEQETARRRLRELGLLDEDRRGVPCKTYFRLRVPDLEALMHGGQASLQFAENPQASLRKTRNLDRGNPASRAAGNPRTITETTNGLHQGTTKDSSRGTRIPADWSLTDQLREAAIACGVPARAVELEAQQFLDHYRAATGKGSTALDWPAKWRTWCRNAVKWTYSKASGNGQRAGGPARHSGFDERDYTRGANADGSL